MTENKKAHSNSNQPLVVILLGPPGSGKGTQAKLLAKDFEIPQISTGDLFREHIAVSSPIGQKAKGYIQAGQLVPDEVVLEMLFDRIVRPDCKKGYLLDGFPRNVSQADKLEKKIDQAIPLIVLCLNVPDDVIVKRAEGRLLCQQCGSIYNRDASPPKKEGICDKCGGQVYRRPDDAPEVVRERLRVYHQQTAPLIDYYKKKGLLKCFDGNMSPEQVHGALKQHILIEGEGRRDKGEN
jgi:adenylate kinase